MHGRAHRPLTQTLANGQRSAYNKERRFGDGITSPGEGGTALIEAVYFDLDDTLYDQLLPFRTAVRQAGFREEDIRDVRIEALYTRLRRHSDRLWSLHKNGELTLKELRIERTTAAFADLGVKITAEAAARLQGHYEREQLRLALRPGVSGLLEQLRACGVRIGLITNGPVDHQGNKIMALGLDRWIMDRFIHISDGIGVAKPDPETFRYAQRLSGLRPEQLAYVGDAWHNDIVPSFRAGWTPIWLNGRKQLPETDDSGVRRFECGDVEQLSALLSKLIAKETGRPV
ncbi:HAD family hydrolase [Paenibacillus arenilitoris]|uniref:HAD family hydrolase n=1 Tax=Paenibacillus arenilitoris TaxID=2772299 RepID=A0A927CP23_9BACL|nr:HAD family hydrolase [Paenibacillus arenilitoris]MBD2870158.1 HAD family hydrolase [Paenibacillus arenilitoris]